MASYMETEGGSEKEKKAVALSSVLAAIFITAFKLLIGLLTHSLGILAEAAHSGLDLVAAAVTYFAVRISGRPADEKQQFGYGKVENLSALFETLLLLVTCVWIIYEALQRLLYKSVEVEVSIWSFIVMITSIVVDVTRSRALMKAAKKHGSQALEADALHFSTDVWSSSVVIGGLLLVTLGEFLQSHGLASEAVITWLYRADAIAALGVSMIVIYVSINMGKRTVEGLLDRAPKGVQSRIVEEVSRIPGLLKVQQVRLRPSGPYTFVDMILEIPRNTSFEQAHSISEQAKGIVNHFIQRADVIIHMDPIVQDEESVIESIRSVAGRNGIGVHSIQVHEALEGINLEMHLEVPETLSVSEAHERVTRVETELRQELPNLKDVVTHIEPLGDWVSSRPADLVNVESLRQLIQDLPKDIEGLSECHNITIYKDDEGISVSFHCTLPTSVNISQAHMITEQAERRVKSLAPEVHRVNIHVEPAEGEEVLN